MRRNDSPKVTRGTLARGASVQVRTISALLIRDMMMRYGRANVGFLWVILEPLILTAGVLVLWSTLRPAQEHGVEVVSIVMTGYMPLTLWRHVTQAGIFAFRRNIGLLYHRHITLLDTLIARMLLEFLGTTGALFVVYLVLLAAGLVEPFRELGMALVGWVSMGAFSIGVGMCIAVLTEYSEASERFIAPFQYFMLPLSGSFFMVEWLPTRVQGYALLNPTVHCYEMFRAGLFGEGVTTHYTIWYPGLCALVCLALGLSVIDAIRDRLHTG